MQTFFTFDSNTNDDDSGNGNSCCEYCYGVRADDQRVQRPHPLQAILHSTARCTANSLIESHPLQLESVVHNRSILSRSFFHFSFFIFNYHYSFSFFMFHFSQLNNVLLLKVVSRVLNNVLNVMRFFNNRLERKHKKERNYRIKML